MSNIPVLLVATHNQGKLREFKSLFKEEKVLTRSLTDFPSIGIVEETGSTFAQNAELKARFYAQQTGLRTLADDSGLEVEALGGAPGIFSARYAGPTASDGERIAHLLSELNRTGDTQRRARFVCAVAIFSPVTEVAHIFTGLCTGKISRSSRGLNGFGYDPIFIPDGFEQTFGELPKEIKLRISHRFRALESARSSLVRVSLV
jgi:XTP/dITP diphosphohydrolase